MATPMQAADLLPNSSVTSRAIRHQTARSRPGTQAVPYESRITEIDLTNAPTWNINESSPPLSPRAAERAAKKMIGDLIPQSKDWRMREVRMIQQFVERDHRDQYWYYEIAFDPVADESVTGWTGPRRPFVVIVLMSGEAIALRLANKK